MARGPAGQPSLAVAAYSARVMAESVAAGGGEAVALDLFGDADTRAAAREWHAIGDAAALRIDDSAFLVALAGLARRGAVAGWVAGSGFDARPDLVARAAAVLPLLGNPPELWRRVRTPGWFYPWLAARRVPHAAASIAPPAQARGWLVKDARACGGWHVREAEGAAAAGGVGRYFQRRVAGEPLSALFLADGRDWRIIGVARQIVRPLGGRPFVYRGCVGPVALPSPTREALDGMLSLLVTELGLVGLNGIDFVLGDDGPLLIELNPRPTASVALFDGGVRGGLLLAHAGVCLGGALAAQAGVALDGVRGTEVVFARRAGRVDAARAARIAGLGWCHDLPAAGMRHAYGDPVCSVGASGASVEEVERLLAARRRQVRRELAA